MYLTFHNLDEKPFQISTDPRFLWFGEKHSEALATLKYGLLECNGFVVLTGDAGTGKTTLINALVESLDEKFLVARINHPSLDTESFLQFIAKKFDPSVTLTHKSDLLLFLESFLGKAYTDGRAVLLIVDEAHRLSVDLMEEIRLLSNIEARGRRLINIFFVGQNELKLLLKSPQCRAVRQRVTLFYNLQSLSFDEIGEYVSHRLKVAGTEQRLFSKPAIREIHRFSIGNPRLINTLCDRALLTAFVQERKRIDADIVIECSREINRYHPSGASFGGILVSRMKYRRRQLVFAAKRRGKALEIKLRSLTARLPSLKRSGRVHGKNKTTGSNIGALSAISRTIAGFVKKNRRELIPVGLIAAIIIFFISFAIGSLSDTSGKHKPSETVQQSMAPGSGSLGSTLGKTLDEPSSEINDHETADPPKTPAGEGPSPVFRTAPEVSPIDRLELAEAAMAQNDYQAVLDIIAELPGPANDEPLKIAQLHSNALTGRAGQIINEHAGRAKTMLQQAVAIYPENAEAFYILGNIFRQEEDYPRAIVAYQSAIRIKPDYSDAYFNLGFIYATKRMYQAAEKGFSQVVRLNPDYLGKALYNLAVVQQKLGKTRQSMFNLERAVALGPKNTKARAYLNRLRQTQ